MGEVHVKGPRLPHAEPLPREMDPEIFMITPTANTYRYESG